MLLYFCYVYVMFLLFYVVFSVLIFYFSVGFMICLLFFILFSVVFCYVSVVFLIFSVLFRGPGVFQETRGVNALDAPNASAETGERHMHSTTCNSQGIGQRYKV